MDEKELLTQRMRELAKRARYTGADTFTRFLEPPHEIIARTCANEEAIHVSFFGGHEGAERRIACFRSDPDEPMYPPISVLAIRWNAKYASPGHRDLLGSLMGLGIERDVLGDIVFSSEDGLCYLFVFEDIERYILSSLDSVGHTRVKTEVHTGELLIREPEGVRSRVTVAALRLDAVLAAACKLSRNEAQNMIRAGHIRVNHEAELKCDARLNAGDLLSVRGHGRYRVLSIDETPTRKGRVAVHVFRYT